jgi:regulatory protein
MTLRNRRDDDSAPAPPKRSAKLYAAWLLGRREYSAKELEQKLKLKGYEPAQIEECLAFLSKHELQSDSRYAQSRVRSKGRQLGNRRLEYDLASKGIDTATAQAAMSSMEDEDARALATARRFEGKELTPALRAKAWRFLMARGFGSSAIKKAVSGLGALADEEGSGDSDLGPFDD